MGGIGYANVYPMERIFRDLRLVSIWTGTNEVMPMIISNEWYDEYDLRKFKEGARNFENDEAQAFTSEEKAFE